jgi:peptidoglycan/LPS O-acetylase OafA/YrhL
LAYIGTISYTAYLSHHVILLLVDKQWPQLNPLVSTTATVALTLAVAEPMRRWVERPCAILRRRLHRGSDGAPGLSPVLPRVVPGGGS